MRKLVQAILLIFFVSASAYAQPDGSRIRAAQVNYVTKRLHLSRDERKRFEPVYMDYEKEIMQTRQSFFGKYKNVNPRNTDEETSKKLIDDNLDYQQQVIAIKRKYNDLFLKVLTPQQLSDMYMAEREFKQMLLQRLNQRRRGMLR